MDSSASLSLPSINEVIDDQHAVLIENIERLEEAMATGQGYAALPQVMRDLDHFAAYHFATEERLMASHNYPLRDMHAIAHQAFAALLGEVTKMVAEGYATSAVELLGRLRGWLKSHTLDWDARLGEYLDSRSASRLID